MSKLFVIAGNQLQGRDYVKRRMADPENEIDYKDFVIVTSSNSLRGYTVEHGVFIGTWRDLPDLDELFQTLIINSRMNPIIRSVYENWKNENVARRVLVSVNGVMQMPNTDYQVTPDGTLTFTNPVQEYVEVDIKSITSPNPQIYKMIVAPGDTMNLKINTHYNII